MSGRPPVVCPCCGQDHRARLEAMELEEGRNPRRRADVKDAALEARRLFLELLASEEPMRPHGGLEVEVVPTAVAVLR